MLLTIGQLAKLCGVTVRAVRHYHRIGLLAEPDRDAAGYRRHAATAVVDLIRIKVLAESGVPLARVRQLIAPRWRTPRSAGCTWHATKPGTSIRAILDSKSWPARCTNGWGSTPSPRSKPWNHMDRSRRRPRLSSNSWPRSWR